MQRIFSKKKYDIIVITLYKTNSQDIRVFDFGCRVKSKTRKPRIFLFLFLSHICTFCFSFKFSFLSFLNFQLQQLSIFEVKDKFPRFASFWFWFWGKIENSQIFEIAIFLSLNLFLSLTFYQFTSLSFLNLQQLQLQSKFKVKDTFLRFSSLRF